MSKLLLLFIFVFSCATIFAQDIIITTKGEEIKSVVTKVGATEVEYKKWSNQKGPIYTLSKREIFMIKYSNGEKDLFSQNLDNDEDNKRKSNNSEYSILSKLNTEVINSYRNDVGYKKGKNYGKRAKQTFNLLWISDESILETTEISCEVNTYLNFARGQQFSGWNDDSSAKMILKLKNKTSNIIYIDLGNSFLAETNKDTKCLYVPASTTDTYVKSGGTSLNLGAISDILGIGGIAGTLAHGTNVHSNTGNEHSVTTFSQRIIAIAPQDVYKLEIPITIYYVPNSKVGTIYDNMSHIYHRAYLTYSKEESFTAKGCIKAYLETKKMIGLHMTANELKFPKLRDCEDLEFPSGKILYTGRYIFKRDN